MIPPSQQVIRFSTFELTLDTGELRKAGVRIALQEHSRRVLFRLLERPGALVTRDELRHALWPSDTFVDFEHGLNTAIKRLRDALGDSADTPHFIETIPRRGYRFIAATESGPHLASSPEQPPGARTSRLPWRQMGLGIGLLISTVVLVTTIAWRPPASSAPVLSHLNVLVTPAEELRTTDPLERGRPSRTAIALSPDGRLLVFSGRRGDRQHLYIRPLDAGDASEVNGSEGAGSPFFSPDGAWIGFWADGKIKKVPVAGGAIIDVCTTAPPENDVVATQDLSISGEIVGASWGSDDTIVFALALGGLWQVAAGGGVPAPLTTLGADETSHRLPHVLPGGEGVLFTVIRTGFDWNDVSTAVRVTTTGERKELVARAVDARYLRSGHLVYATDGVLLAQSFDSTRMEVSGASRGVLDNVMHAIGSGSSTLDTGAAQVAMSATGTLAYVRGGAYPTRKRRLVWVDAEGRESPVGVTPNAYLAPRLSRDGRQIAVMLHPSRHRDVWIHTPPDGPSSRITFGGLNAFPVWMPDGRGLTIARALRGPAHLFSVSLTAGQHEPELLASPGYSEVPADWTPDGDSLVFVQEVQDKPWDIWALTRENTTWRSTPVVRSRFSDFHPALSPDGRWLAYVSDESGSRPEVYVQPFPGPGTRQQISSNGGREPLWARDGGRLYYLVPNSPDPGDGHVMMAVPVSTGPKFTAGTPKPLFPTRYGGTVPVRGYDIAADGRFLMVLSDPVPTGVTTHLDVIQNWPQGSFFGSPSGKSP